MLYKPSKLSGVLLSLRLLGKKIENCMRSPIYQARENEIVAGNIKIKSVFKQDESLANCFYDGYAMLIKEMVVAMFQCLYLLFQ